MIKVWCVNPSELAGCPDAAVFPLWDSLLINFWNLDGNFFFFFFLVCQDLSIYSCFLINAHNILWFGCHSLHLFWTTFASHVLSWANRASHWCCRRGWGDLIRVRQSFFFFFFLMSPTFSPKLPRRINYINA